MLTHPTGTLALADSLGERSCSAYCGSTETEKSSAKKRGDGERHLEQSLGDSEGSFMVNKGQIMTCWGPVVQGGEWGVTGYMIPSCYMLNRPTAQLYTLRSCIFEK